MEVDDMPFAVFGGEVMALFTVSPFICVLYFVQPRASGASQVCLQDLPGLAIPSASPESFVKRRVVCTFGQIDSQPGDQILGQRQDVGAAMFRIAGVDA
jgi:hypothetical protein